MKIANGQFMDLVDRALALQEQDPDADGEDLAAQMGVKPKDFSRLTTIGQAPVRWRAWIREGKVQRSQVLRIVRLARKKAKKLGVDPVSLLQGTDYDKILLGTPQQKILVKSPITALTPPLHIEITKENVAALVPLVFEIVLQIFSTQGMSVGYPTQQKLKLTPSQPSPPKKVQQELTPSVLDATFTDDKVVLTTKQVAALCSCTEYRANAFASVWKFKQAGTRLVWERPDVEAFQPYLSRFR